MSKLFKHPLIRLFDSSSTRLIVLAGFTLCGLLTSTIQAGSPAALYRSVPASELRSALPPDGKSSPAYIAKFSMRALPVSVAEYQRFLVSHPKWQRGGLPRLLADANYLLSWPSSKAAPSHRLRQPVTEVSWFAAQAYCESEGARLPTWHEWELVAAADKTRKDARNDPEWRNKILHWYSRPSSSDLPSVGAGESNVYGVGDMHGVVWEWTYDFASLMVSVDNREQGDPDTLRFCGAGALSMNDRDNYAVLMRIALLSSLQANSTTRNLGFRCAKPS
jgi:formylglycine-generating enzyme